MWSATSTLYASTGRKHTKLASILFLVRRVGGMTGRMSTRTKCWWLEVM
jgi:hypothetical protein